MKQEISIFGSGKVGHALYDLFKNLTYPVKLISSRPGFGYDLAKSVLKNSDLVFITCPSAVIGSIAADLSASNSHFVHCSGADALSLLDVKKRGVFYPLQTFSGQEMDWTNIPVFIQGDEETLEVLETLAKDCRLKHHRTTDEQRARMHLAAVFANNFTNAIYQASKTVLNNLPFEHLIPLIRETTKNIETREPKETQTGPAVRGDQATIKRHLEMLKSNKPEQELYQVITEYIQSSK